MKQLLIVSMLLISFSAFAEPLPQCVEDYWDNQAIANCVAREWNWDEQQEEALLDRIDNNKVEIDIFDATNDDTCPIKLSVYDPFITEKEQFFECGT